MLFDQSQLHNYSLGSLLTDISLAIKQSLTVDDLSTYLGFFSLPLGTEQNNCHFNVIIWTIMSSSANCNVFKTQLLGLYKL